VPNNRKSSLILPNAGAQIPDLGQVNQPRTTAIFVDTDQGRLAFPQVAIAMVSPDVLGLIAHAVVNVLNGEPPFSPEGSPEDVVKQAEEPDITATAVAA
jgi:hypothetical protein